VTDRNERKIYLKEKEMKERLKKQIMYKEGKKKRREISD
jgi:hypothetical protein